MEQALRTKEDHKVLAKKQKEELTDLYYGKNRPKFTQGIQCYIIEKSFLDSWRSFVR